MPKGESGESEALSDIAFVERGAISTDFRIKLTLDTSVKKKTVAVKYASVLLSTANTEVALSIDKEGEGTRNKKKSEFSQSANFF